MQQRQRQRVRAETPEVSSACGVLYRAFAWERVLEGSLSANAQAFVDAVASLLPPAYPIREAAGCFLDVVRGEAPSRYRAHFAERFRRQGGSAAGLSAEYTRLGRLALDPAARPLLSDAYYQALRAVHAQQPPAGPPTGPPAGPPAPIPGRGAQTPCDVLYAAFEWERALEGDVHAAAADYVRFVASQLPPGFPIGDALDCFVERVRVDAPDRYRDHFVGRFRAAASGAGSWEAALREISDEYRRLQATRLGRQARAVLSSVFARALTAGKADFLRQASAAMGRAVDAPPAQASRSPGGPSPGRTAGTDCSKVITLPQNRSTCWFNALLMAVFYSDGMRGVVRSLVPQWKAERDPGLAKLYAIFTKILERRYTYDFDAGSANYRKMFENIYPENILEFLNRVDAKALGLAGDYRVGADAGYNSSIYVRFLFETLKLRDVQYLNYSAQEHVVAYAGERVVTARHGGLAYYWPLPASRASVGLDRPRVLVVDVRDPIDVSAGSAPLELAETIAFKGRRYRLDAKLIGNHNDAACGLSHEIAGITCAGARFVYNGWTRTTVDPALKKANHNRAIPCELMKFDWASDDQDFCLNPAACRLDSAALRRDSPAVPRDAHSEMCFNFQKDGLLFYVLDDEPAVTPPPPERR